MDKIFMRELSSDKAPNPDKGHSRRNKRRDNELYKQIPKRYGRPKTTFRYEDSGEEKSKVWVK